MSDTWKPLFSRGEVVLFSIARSPYVHGDGSRYEFLLTVHTLDGRTIPMRVATVESFTGLVDETRPLRVSAADEADAPMVEMAALLERAATARAGH